MADATLARRAVERFAREDPGLDPARTLARIDELARDAARRLERAGGPRERVQALNRFFFDERGFTADADLTDPDNLYPDRVLRRRRGYCTGLATIYLAVAGRLGLPVAAVSTPAHVFLRYDDGVTRINIETLEGGREISDDTYRTRYAIPEAAVQRGAFLAPLSEDGFLSQLVNNLGVLASRRDGPAASLPYFREAIGLDPHNVTAIYNQAREQMREDDLARALLGFTAALDLNPADVAALTNRGAVRLRLGDRDGAVADFLAALAVDPDAREPRRNLEAVLGSGDGGS